MESMDRRRFNEITAAAFGGVLAGTISGCSGSPESAAVARGDLHLCRGLNECQGKGADGKNSCRGQGSCATTKPTSCATQNECKGLGGCGEFPGMNACKGKGGCHVPLMEIAWEKVRGRMETQWKSKSQPFGAAPAKNEKPTTAPANQTPTEQPKPDDKPATEEKQKPETPVKDN